MNGTLQYLNNDLFPWIKEVVCSQLTPTTKFVLLTLIPHILDSPADGEENIVQAGILIRETGMSSNVLWAHLQDAHNAGSIILHDQIPPFYVAEIRFSLPES